MMDANTMTSFIRVMSDNREDIKTLAGSKGGWELWVQCQVELQIRKNNECFHIPDYEYTRLEIERSPMVYTSTEMVKGKQVKRRGFADIYCKLPYNRAFVAELKCLNKGSDNAWKKMLEKDRDKFKGGILPKYKDCRFYSIGIMTRDPEALSAWNPQNSFCPWTQISDTDVWYSFHVFDQAQANYLPLTPPRE